jgi:transcriptional regulator with XRE-family HTH domain
VGDSQQLESLRPGQQIAAVLEAQNESREVVARIAGVSESQVARWRRDERYRATVAELRSRGLAEVQGQLGKLRAELLDAARVAVKTLLRLADATDSDGNPLLATQQKAAEALLGNVTGYLRAEAGKDGGGGGDAAVPTTAVIVVQRGGDERPPIDSSCREID